MNLNLSDEVWYITCGNREDKKLNSTKEQRLEMTKISIENYFEKSPFKEKIKVFRKHLFKHNNLQIDETEIDNGDTIPTYFLLKKLTEVHKNSNYLFSWITGSDLIDDLELWHEGKKLKKEFRFIIIPRINKTFKEENLPLNYEITKDFTVGDLSSTRVRNRIGKGIGVYGLLEPEVLSYIQENELYTSN